MTNRLADIYDRLYGRFGPQRWWPAESPFEVIVGAILTQNTNWKNVEKAITNLRAADALDIVSIDQMSLPDLQELIRPSGFFRQKAERLQLFTRFLTLEYSGRLEILFAHEDEVLRKTLLAQPGIGPETADSILLYAANRPSFVVDAYTHRIFRRIGINRDDSSYEQTRTLFMDNLPSDTRLFNEYHALIVRLAKEFCRKQKPLCLDCPLLTDCVFGKVSTKD